MGHSGRMELFSASLAFIDGLGAPEMLLIFVLVLVLFGGQKLPEFARGLGKTMREFKKAAAGVEEEFKRALEEDERKQTTPQLTAPAPDPLPPVAATSDVGGPSADPHAQYTDHEVQVDESVHDHHHSETESYPSPNANAPVEPTIMPPDESGEPKPATSTKPAPPPPPPPAVSYPENPS